MATEALETIEEDQPSVNLGGRPTAFRLHYAKQAYRLALLGATNEDLAAAFDVTIATIQSWKQAHPRFLSALTRGKEKADANVAHKLYHRALGYQHKETKAIVVDGSVETIDVIKHYPPDTAAAKLWLTNRRPDLWRDRSNIDVTSNGQTVSSLAAAAWAYAQELKAQQIAIVPAPALPESTE